MRKHFCLKALLVFKTVQWAWLPKHAPASSEIKYESRGWKASWLAPHRCACSLGRSGCAPQCSDYSQEWWCGHCSDGLDGLYAIVEWQQLFVPTEAYLPAVQAHRFVPVTLIGTSSLRAVWKLCLLLPFFAWWCIPLFSAMRGLCGYHLAVAVRHISTKAFFIVKWGAARGTTHFLVLGLVLFSPLPSCLTSSSFPPVFH